jgi:nucleotidyltransferase/DNA polymerase involved in DNA repair
VTLLPLKRELVERLHWLGLRSIGQLAQLSCAALVQQFGAVGEQLFTLAHGDDPPPATLPPTPEPPAVRCGWRFPGGVADRTVVGEALERLAERLTMRLDQQGYAAQALTLILEHEGGTETGTRRLAHPTADIRMLCRALQALFDDAALSGPVERVRVEVVPTARQVRQATLFDDAEQHDALDALVARLAARHGPALLRAAVSTASGSGCLEQQVQLLPWETQA